MDAAAPPDADATLGPLLYDAFPGRVVAPNGMQHDRCRALLTPTHLWVLVDRQVGGSAVPRALLTVPITATRPSPGEGWCAVDADGGEWRIGRSSWCGCGSSLRYLPSPIPIYPPAE